MCKAVGDLSSRGHAFSCRKNFSTLSNMPCLLCKAVDNVEESMPKCRILWQFWTWADHFSQCHRSMRLSVNNPNLSYDTRVRVLCMPQACPCRRPCRRLPKGSSGLHCSLDPIPTGVRQRRNAVAAPAAPYPRRRISIGSGTLPALHALPSVNRLPRFPSLPFASVKKGEGTQGSPCASL